MSRPPSHGDGCDDGPTGETRMTRRSVLARSAAAVGAGAVAGGSLAGASGVAAGQITEAAVIPEPTQWEDVNFAGFMIHVGGSISPEQAQVAEDCEMGWSDTWPPDEMLAYDAQLINRKDDSTAEAETTLYIGASADVTPGKLYIINRFNRCDSDFLGLSLEQIGLSDVNVDVDEQATDRPAAEDERTDAATTAAEDGGGFGAVGPGFGPVAALAGLLGGGALLRRRDDD